MLLAIIILTTKLMLIKIRHYQSKNTVKKLRNKKKNIVNNVKNSNTWKTQLTISTNFMFFKGTDRKCVIHSKSDNMEVMKRKRWIYDSTFWFTSF